MNTPQPSALLKKLIAAVEQVGHYLEIFRGDFNRKNDSVRASEISKYQGGAQPVWLEPILTKYDQSERNREKKDNLNYRVQNSLRWATWFTFGAVVIYVGVTLLIYCANNQAAKAAIQSADIAGEALHSAQRAFVYNTYTQGQEGNFARIAFRWQNDGLTPTREMTMHVSFGEPRINPLPDDFDFHDIWQPGEPHTPSRVAASAKGQAQTGEIRIPISILRKFPYYYVWGWTRYRDVFPDTPEHITRFCTEFKPMLFVQNTVNIHTAGMDGSCGRYNCEDEQCRN